MPTVSLAGITCDKNKRVQHLQKMFLVNLTITSTQDYTGTSTTYIKHKMHALGMLSLGHKCIRIKRIFPLRVLCRRVTLRLRCVQWGRQRLYKTRYGNDKLDTFCLGRSVSYKTRNGNIH